ncbi:unnamed protein product, partial [Didymodactylos carnosus]
MVPKRIAIIGAGPSGLAQLHAFENVRQTTHTDNFPEIVCYEKQENWGGLWNLTYRTGVDKYGDPLHNSMYRSLWSNAPKEAHEYPDYSFEQHLNGQIIPSYVPRSVFYDYIIARNTIKNIRKYIQFEMNICWITYSDKIEKFKVAIKDRKNDQLIMETFDYVIVATGHFSTPNMPEFDGTETFPGRILHSHDFRNAEEFIGQNILIIGNGYSGEDIALQCYKYGCKSVTISYHKTPKNYKWPQCIKEVPSLERLSNKTAYFIDGTTESDIDSIILCTGYQHYFPFMDDILRLKTWNSLYPPGLYKGLFWLKQPKLIYL